MNGNRRSGKPSTTPGANVGNCVGMFAGQAVSLLLMACALYKLYRDDNFSALALALGAIVAMKIGDKFHALWCESWKETEDDEN